MRTALEAATYLQGQAEIHSRFGNGAWAECLSKYAASIRDLVFFSETVLAESRAGLEERVAEFLRLGRP